MLLRRRRTCAFASKPSRSRRLTALDLFAGAGGLSLGLRQAGFRVVGAVEIDHTTAKSYTRNHPRVHMWKHDIRRLRMHRVMQVLGLRRGQLDLLAGCPPCQGFSELRTLNGSVIVDEPQNELLFEFFRFVKALRPKAIMLENVPALAKDARLKKFLDDIAIMGYVANDNIVRVCNAADYGVPQRRRRMILMSSRLGVVPFAPKDRNRGSVRSAIGGLPVPGSTGDPLHDFPERRSPEVLERIMRTPPDGGSRRDLGATAQLPCHTACDGFKDVYGRMSWDKVAPTITGGCINPSKGRFLHPNQHRAITLREAALLQSFPLDYYFDISRGKNHTAQQIGNALPPEFIRRHASRIRNFLVEHVQQGTNDGNA